MTSCNGNVASVVAFLCAINVVSGVPLSPSDFKLDGEATKPCFARYVQVHQQMRTFGDITTAPYYIPDCSDDGLTWKAPQCDHHERGYCFCVDEETGKPRAGTETGERLKELLDCESGAEESSSPKQICQRKLDMYLKFMLNYRIANALDYRPDCRTDGLFSAMQRNEREFFCVDMATGEKIPGTEVGPDSLKPLDEAVCNSFSNLYQSYKEIQLNLQQPEKAEAEQPIVNATSCRPGTEYKSCGCERRCELGSNLRQLEVIECEVCKPVCVCPEESFNYNGICVSAEECVATVAALSSSGPKIMSWSEYQVENADYAIQAFRQISREEIGQFLGYNYLPGGGENTDENIDIIKVSDAGSEDSVSQEREESPSVLERHSNQHEEAESVGGEEETVMEQQEYVEEHHQDEYRYVTDEDDEDNFDFSDEAEEEMAHYMEGGDTLEEEQDEDRFVTDEDVEDNFDFSNEVEEEMAHYMERGDTLEEETHEEEEEEEEEEQGSDYEDENDVYEEEPFESYSYQELYEHEVEEYAYDETNTMPSSHDVVDEETSVEESSSDTVLVRLLNPLPYKKSAING